MDLFPRSLFKLLFIIRIYITTFVLTYNQYTLNLRKQTKTKTIMNKSQKFCNLGKAKIFSSSALINFTLS
jgi:hypothetical protein